MRLPGHFRDHFRDTSSPKYLHPRRTFGTTPPLGGSPERSRDVRKCHPRCLRFGTFGTPTPHRIEAASWRLVHG